ncbi:hypothetical protein COCNU_03G014630 [Cocos nucifera]|uniref:Uncharacterized protein n=1 Tax=Cocos nucifera TaxID=13894 RepID=A0A8K0I4D0_COCNU|nr:hypothetical protein COCNU_03G014630 [Cocos nucifera]
MDIRLRLEGNWVSCADERSLVVVLTPTLWHVVRVGISSSDEDPSRKKMTVTSY